MIRSKYSISALLTSILLAACGGSDGGDDGDARYTTGSSNLTGLWRLNSNMEIAVMKRSLNMSFTLRETSGGLTMTDCVTRQDFSLNYVDGFIEELPVGLGLGVFTVVDNDTMSASDEGMNTGSSKMSTAAGFDMGEMSLTTPEMGSKDYTDVCVESSNMAVMGDVVTDSVAATSIYNGAPFSLVLTSPQDITVGEYDITRFPDPEEGGGIVVGLTGEAISTLYGTAEIALDSGTLTVTKYSLTEFDGTFTGTLSNGSAISGSFGLEFP